MDTSLKLERVIDKDYIKSVLSKMWDNVCEDGHALSDFDPKVLETCWVKVGDYGLYCLHPHNKVTLEIHAFILPEHRKEQSIKTGKEILKWIYKECEQYKKIIAQIPALYPNVKKFCLKQGFQLEGINRLSHLKNGELVDQWLLGITRDEIEVIL